MSFTELEYHIQDGIGHMVMKRPPVNALGHTLLAEILAAAEAAAADAVGNRLRALLIRGEGKVFCAGADLKERMATPQEKVEAAVRHISGAIRAIGRVPVPVIALVHGSAMGGGLELALAADLRVMTDTAKVGLREVTLGIIPGAGGTQRLPKIIGYSKALYWITSGHVFTGAEAHAQGVADFLAADADLIDKGLALAQEIAANGPLAVRQAKAAVRASFDLPLEQGLDRECELYKPVIATRDRVEGLQAFHDKRPPRYTGA